VGAILSIGEGEPLPVLSAVDTEPYLIGAGREFRRQIEPHPCKLELIRSVVVGGEIDLGAQYTVLIDQVNEILELDIFKSAPGQLDRHNLSCTMWPAAGSQFADFKRPVKADICPNNVQGIRRGEGKHNQLFASQPLCKGHKIVLLDMRKEYSTTTQPASKAL
jgi:hypothetical protein